ncbi:MAG: SDR family oxidoreductase [Alphaproteobacteria bacterium]|nr:SDR family oxidoreductase [Alphaproteobacteria bacterium]
MPVAIVTGAGARIGQAIALSLAADGFDLAVHYRASAEGAEQTVSQIQARGGKAVAFQADLAKPADIDAMMDAISERLGPATVLINSASLFEYDLAADWGIDGFDHHMAVNLRAPLQLAQRMIADLPEDLSEKETGCVVNLLDQKLFNLNPDFFTYTISKQALKGATELLAQAAAPRCRVNAVAPGLILRSGDQTQEQFESVHAMTPLGRGATADDITDAVRYLVRASAVTGVVLPVDCGQRLQSSDRDVMFLDTSDANRTP